MRVLVWLTEGTWEAAVDAARELASGRDAEVVLLHVDDVATADAWSAASAGLLGRGGAAPSATPLAGATRQLLEAAELRLGLPSSTDERAPHGHERVETVVVDACRDADVLVCSRDGDRPGPHSLAPPTRFVVDHAPCDVVLVWARG
ncbi:universal stress protein [Luteimicrobium sp. DT211]|uniref:universal stress protein n=1 Tax=Luteimicrobium sp. DT211 TaxID=3393412 RepID=UPI003CF83C19